MIVTENGTLDLEDARVVSVSRADHEVRISFERARLMPPESDAFQPCTVTLALAGVSAESARYYVGPGVTAPHPDPSHPLDLVELFEYSAAGLNLQGLRFNEPWYEWEIASQGVALEAVAFDKHAAQPVVPADAPKAARR